MKKLIGFVVILAAGGGGWWYYIKYGTPPEKPTVNYATVSKGRIVEAVTSTGTLEPLRRFDVGSQVSGTVQAIYADFNSLVKKGDLLAKIDPQLLQVQVDVQTANVERQKSDIASQEVQLEDQKKQAERTKSLFEKGLQNQQQYEAAVLATKTREAQITSARKQLVQAEANLSSAKLNVSYTDIIAPNDGVVVERKVDVGQFLQASMTAPSFFVLATPLETLKLTAFVDEAEIGRIRSGMPVVFTVDAFGRREFRGTVNAVRLNASTNNNVVTYPVWIDVPNDDLTLRPSLTASQLRIVISTAEDVIRVPNQALRFRPNAEIYTALGLTPPAPGSGGRPAGMGGDDPNGGRTGATPGARPGGQGAGAQQGAQPGAQRGQQSGAQNRQAQGGGNPGGSQGGQQGQEAQRAPGGRGFGQPGQSFTPEQMKRYQDAMARRGGGAGMTGGGRGQGGASQGRPGGGRGQGQGQRGQNVEAAPAGRPSAQKIDELWAPVQRTQTRSQVYTWNEATKELKMLNVVLGVTDGSFSELISGDLKVGDQIVTGVILPASLQRANTTGNPFAPNQGRPSGMSGFSGMGGMPSGGGGGDRGSSGSSSGRGGGGGR